jgi:hypothetical protein
MAANATAVRPARLPAAKQPPENSVWIRYHPWIEGALSFISSNALHALVIGAAVLWSTYLIYAFGFAQPPRSLPVAPVRLAVAGGDNRPVGAAEDGRHSAPPKEEAGPDRKDVGDGAGPVSPTDPPQLLVPPQKETPEFPEPEPRRIRPGGNSMQSFETLDRGLRDMHEKMSEGANPSKHGGTGTVAEPGPGAGPGSGPGTPGDPSSVAPPEKVKCQMRWSMRFDTRNSGDYLRQLEGLGVVLAIPDGPNSYRVVDLTKRPFKPENKDMSTSKKIWWFDNDPRSVQGLMTAMGLPFRPQRDVAFIPQEVEEELAKKELETGLKVDDVFETTFGVRVPGAGGRKYDIWVIGQKTNEEMKRAKR